MSQEDGAGSSSDKRGGGNSAVFDEDFEDDLPNLDQDGAGGGFGSQASAKPLPLDLYAVLNVSKQATNEEIKIAYRRMCVLYHPDKHLNEADKEAAQRKFQLINRAYEVLSSPTSRSIYDVYGIEGVESNLEVGMALKTPAEIREEFERKQREKAEQELQRSSHSKGSLTVFLDATNTFNPYFGKEGIPRGLKDVQALMPDINRLSISQSLVVAVNESTQFGIQGVIVSRNGIGVGNVGFTFKKSLPSSSIEINFIGGTEKSIAIKYFRLLPYSCFGSVETTFKKAPEDPDLLQLGTNVTVGRPLSTQTTGFITYTSTIVPQIDFTPLSSSLILGTTKANNTQQMRTTLQMGVLATMLDWNYMYRVSRRTRLQCRIELGTNGLQTSIGGEQQITDHVKAATSLEIGLLQGVRLRFRFTRIGQTFSFPILLSHELSAKIIFIGALIPAGISWFVKKFVINPQERQRLEQLRRENREFREQQKKEAEEAIKLMKDFVARKVEIEEKKGGLIIVEAFYGKLDATPERLRETSESPIIDVTIPLQSLVSNSQLHLHAGSKSNLIGFYDPCIGEEKKLRIRYLFKRRMHLVTIRDDQSVSMPLRQHLISDDLAGSQ